MDVLHRVAKKRPSTCPHLNMAEGKNLINSNQRIISAELPNPEEDPMLFEIITKNMIHGPCGMLNPNSPCMNTQCTKRYPRQLTQETQTGDDGYPLYRRWKPEDGGQTAMIKLQINNQYTEMDNKWVVPYTTLLSKMYQAHINVEYCNSVAVKMWNNTLVKIDIEF